MNTMHVLPSFAAVALLATSAYAESSNPQALLDRLAAARQQPANVAAHANVRGRGPCGTDRLREVHALIPAMTPQQQEQLAQLAPAFEPVVRRLRDQRAGRPTASALPNEPTLNQQLVGPNSIIHYTLAGPDASPNLAYVEAVQSAIEASIKSEGKTFRKAIPEGPDGKLHVYVGDTVIRFPADGPFDGFCQATTNPATPATAPCYMFIDTKLQTRYPADWRVQLKLTCYHEYMHGVQFAYNLGSSSWFKEGQAVWAEVKFGNSNAGLINFMNAATSVANQPERALYDAGNIADIREYSTGAFMLHLAKEKGTKSMKNWLKNTEAEDVAQKALVQTVGGIEKFQKLYRLYLLKLYQRKIPQLGNQQPAVPEQPAATQLGTNLAANVPPTGARFRLIKKDTRIKNDYWIAKVNAGSGHPEAAFVKDPKDADKVNQVVEPEDDYTELDGYNKQDEVLAILTDTNTEAETFTGTPVNGQVLSPYIKEKNTVAQSPIDAGTSGRIDITYDLLGTPEGQTRFPVEVRVVEKGPDVSDNASGDFNYNVGENQLTTFFFNTVSTTKGLYRFRLTFVTPTEGFSMNKLPRSKTQSKFSIFVKASTIPQPALPLGAKAGSLTRAPE